MRLLLALTLLCSLVSSYSFAFYTDDDGYSSVLGFYYDSNGNPDAVSSSENNQLSDASSSEHQTGIFFTIPIAGWDKKEVVNQLTNLVADEEATPGQFAKMVIESFRSKNDVSESEMNDVEIATIILDDLQN